MHNSRLILVDGLPVTGRTRLGQELALQLEGQGTPHHFWPEHALGHPLKRPYEPAEYPSFQDYAETLSWQWRNFAIRSSASDERHVLDAALFSSPLRDALSAGVPEADLQALVANLLDAMAPLEPALFYLSRSDAPDQADARQWLRWQQFCDGTFGALDHHRLLLNASRSTPAQLLDDVLEALNLDAAPFIPDQDVAHALPGRYVNHEMPDQVLLEIRQQGAELLARVQADADERWLPLLGSPNGHFVIAGVDIQLYPQRVNGRLQGLVPETGSKPWTDQLPQFLLPLPGA